MGQSLTFELDTDIASAFARALKVAPEVVKEEFAAATLEALLLLEGLTKDFTPIGVTGNLRGAWAHELMGNSAEPEVLGRLFNPLPYAAPVETGTRPHWAPLEPLVDWVRAKLDIADDEEARRVARLIQFKIAAKGTKGAGMAARAMDTGREDIKRGYREAYKRAFARIG